MKRILPKLYIVEKLAALTKKVASIAVIASLATSSQADTLDLSLSDSTAKGDYQAEFKNRRNFYYGGTFLFHEDDGHIVGGTLHVIGRSKATTFKQYTGLGTKLIAYDAGDPTGSALAVGGFILHNLASANLLTVRADAYYAPSIVSFGDGERYLELGLRMEYKIVEQASVYLGYRNIEIDFKRVGDQNIDESAHVGMVLHF